MDRDQEGAFWAEQALQVQRGKFEVASQNLSKLLEMKSQLRWLQPIKHPVAQAPTKRLVSVFVVVVGRVGLVVV